LAKRYQKTVTINQVAIVTLLRKSSGTQKQKKDQKFKRQIFHNMLFVCKGEQHIAKLNGSS